MLNMAGYVRGSTHWCFYFSGNGLSLIDDNLLVVYGRYYLNRQGLIPEGPKGHWRPKGWSHRTASCADAQGCAYQVVPEGPPWAAKPGCAVAKFAKGARAFKRDFLYAGRKKLPAPTEYLGVPHEPGDDETHFKSISAIATDGELNLYVVDSGRKGLRVFRKDGYYLGEMKSVIVDGVSRPFDATHLAVTKMGEIYALLSPEDKRRGRKTLVKLRDWKTPAAVWTVPLAKTAACVAVDEQANPRIVWVGNGAGYYTLSRLIDLGDSIGPVTTVGGRPVDALRMPTAVGVDAEGNGYIYDCVDGNVLRISPEGKFTKVLTMGPSGPISPMTVDPEHGYVYVVKKALSLIHI